MLIQKIEDEIRNINFDNELIPTISIIANNLNSLGKESILNSLFDKLKDCPADIILDYLSNIKSFDDSICRFIIEKYENF